MFLRELKIECVRSIRAEIAHWLLFRGGAGSDRVCLTLGHLVVFLYTRKHQRIAAGDVRSDRNCVNCDNLSRQSEPLVLDVCDLHGSFGVFDLDPRIQIIPVEHPIQVHTAGPGDMCHGQAPALCHLDHVGEARSGK